jgi:dTDP-4-dehydrorhamnose reductase
MPPAKYSFEKKRVVVVGSSGRLGGLLVRTLSEANQVVGLTRSDLDLACEASIATALEPLDFDFLILAGALTAVDYCEAHGDEAFAINGTGAGKVARICALKGAHMTYVSTDMVFNGDKVGPYHEADITDPISIYGVSKLMGERLVLSASPGNLVVRISWLYGPGKPAFPEWIVEKACTESSLSLPGNKICCPTFSGDLVDYMVALLGSLQGPAYGIYHLCNSRPCTWRDWGQFCIDTAREAGLPVVADFIESVPVDSVKAFVAKRPVNSAMSTAKFTQLTGIEPRDWRDAIREFLPNSESFRKYLALEDAP